MEKNVYTKTFCWYNECIASWTLDGVLNDIPNLIYNEFLKYVVKNVFIEYIFIRLINSDLQ